MIIENRIEKKLQPFFQKRSIFRYTHLAFLDLLQKFLPVDVITIMKLELASYLFLYLHSQITYSYQNLWSFLGKNRRFFT